MSDWISMLEEAWIMVTWGSPLALLLTVILGASLGSFANVVIWRLPRGQSLVKPASRCPACSRPIPPWHNIPILSFMLLRGQAACCGAPISARYPIIELISALILGTLYWAEGWSWVFLFTGAWMILLLILAVIDLEFYRLPNPLVAAGAVISLLWMIVAPQQGWLSAAAGFGTGLGFAGLMMLVGKAKTGRLAGFGDLKLAAVLGFTFGPGRFVLLMLTAALSALVWGLIQRRRGSERRIPMGPFFALGAWVVIWLGETMVRWYLGLFMLGH
ncbi:MAG: prepilin peptidase [Candidatus Zixiibacteriota bacterium]|nr:MAG: prepilin peptidase [candidate division Zixibacteria bacterium]